MKHIKAPEPLGLAADEVGEESQRIRDAFRKNNRDPALKAIEYAKKLEVFVGKVHAVEEGW